MGAGGDGAARTSCRPAASDAALTDLNGSIPREREPKLICRIHVEASRAPPRLAPFIANRAWRRQPHTPRVHDRPRAAAQQLELCTYVQPAPSLRCTCLQAYARLTGTIVINSHACVERWQWWDAYDLQRRAVNRARPAPGPRRAQGRPTTCLPNPRRRQSRHRSRPEPLTAS